MATAKPQPAPRPTLGCPGCQAAAASSSRTADARAGNTSSGTTPTGRELPLPNPGCTYTLTELQLPNMKLDNTSSPAWCT